MLVKGCARSQCSPFLLTSLRYPSLTFMPRLRKLYEHQLQSSGRLTNEKMTPSGPRQIRDEPEMIDSRRPMMSKSHENYFNKDIMAISLTMFYL